MTVHHRNYDVMLGQSSWRLHQRGFTLIELIMVIVLMGVLAVFAAPRIFNSDDFNARGFHDETLAFLRYAQKTAIAQRRTVCVVFSGTTSASLRIASAAATPTCNTDLRGPKGDSPGTITAKGNVVYGALPANFGFDGLGQPVDGMGALVATQTIQISNAANVMVEAGTGYVHD
ncbi:MAG: type II secretion system protein [Gallionella sp.]|nr:type II secretion system protein [Gallionella sp.]